MKRGQASYTLLYIAAGIITAIVIYYGVGSILGFRQRGEEAETVLFKQQVSTDVNRLSAQLGAARNLSYLMPPQFNTICYVDTSKRQEILEKITDFVTDKKIISIINDSIYSNNTNNVFLFGAETDAYYAGKVQICKVPIKCFEAEGGRVVVEIYGGGGFALLEPCEPVINLPPIVYPLTEKNVFITLPRGQPFPEEEILAWAEDPELGDLNIDWYIMNTTGNLSEPVRTNTSDPTPVYTNYSLQTYDYGLYKATVVATDTSGKAGSTAFEFKIMISPPGNLLPFANITLPEDEEKFDVGYTVAFEGRGNDSDSEELTYEWQFGDGFVENGVSPPRSAGEEFVTTTSHTYLHDGIYTVKFTVRDNESSYFDAINIIIGNSPPDVTMDFPLQNEVITYTDVTFGYTPSDRDHEKQQTLSCLIILDGERISLGDITIEPPLTVPQTFLKQGMSEGEHTWSVACSDGITTNTVSTMKFTIAKPLNLQCSVAGPANPCQFTKMFSLSDTSNAHASQNPDYAPYLQKVCCNMTKGAEVLTLDRSTSCSQHKIIRLSSENNAHAGIPESTDYTDHDVCFTTLEPNVGFSCLSKASCGSDETCVVALSGTSNAHVADCSSPYTNKICCKAFST